MKRKKPTAGERMIESAKQGLAFAAGKQNHGCEIHAPDQDSLGVPMHIEKEDNREWKIVRLRLLNENYFVRLDLGWRSSSCCCSGAFRGRGPTELGDLDREGGCC